VLSELREAYRAAPEESDAALLLARLYLSRGEVRNALNFISRHREARGFATPEMYLLASRIAVAAGHEERARKILKELREKEGGGALAVAELASLERKQGLPAAERAIETSGLDLGDPANEPALRAWVQLRVERGEARSALARVEKLAAARPDAAGLRAIAGMLLLTLGEEGPAEQRFQEALDRQADHAAALAGQAEVALRRGDAQRAGELFERAAAAARNVAEYAYGVARARFAAGDEPGAESALRTVVLSHPEFGPAANDLAWLLAKRGESLDFALRLAQRAVRVAPSAETRDTLGFVHWRRGEAEPARRAFEAALALRPEYGTAGYHLALLQLEAGERDAARAGLERALAGGSFPEADEARAALDRLRAP
jgi:tetratricopeptide (TPR) repeat protein